MDNKNVFIAIALSMSVLLFWAAFFESPRPINQNIEKTQKQLKENNITPNINEPLKIKKISREESLKASARVKIENDSIIGSMSLEGSLIDDISFKKHKQNLENNLWPYKKAIKHIIYHQLQVIYIVQHQIMLILVPSNQS